MKASKVLSIIIPAIIGVIIAMFVIEKNDKTKPLEHDTTSHQTQIKQDISLENQSQTAIESLSDNTDNDIAKSDNDIVELDNNIAEPVNIDPIPTITSEKLIYMITLKTNKGDIELTLDAGKAPNTVANFIQYAKDGQYDGTIFHRVIKGFMIQGGGFEAGLKQKEVGAPILNEANNGLKNDKYTVAMARTNDPHSATAQFFINATDNDFLNFKSESGSGWGYAVFGEVTKGQEVVDLIEGVSTGSSQGYNDVPLEDVIIESVTVSE